MICQGVKKSFARAAGAALMFVTAGAAADYVSEAQALADKIVAVHPNGHEISESDEFQAARAALLAVANDADYPQYAMAVGRMFNAADDGHTAFIPAMGTHPAFTMRYPILARRFDDGLYVIGAKDEATPLLGARISKIGGQSINDIVRMFTEVSSGGSPAWPMNFVGLSVVAPGWLAGFGMIDTDFSKPVTFEAETPDGSTITADLFATPDGQDGREQIKRKPYPLERAANGFQNYLDYPDGECLLVAHIGTMSDDNGQTFEAFSDAVIAASDRPCVDRVVLDLRNNGGGNNQLTKPLHRFFVKSRFNRPGGIYVLISPNTFSAAMNFATRLERETDAIFVGEPTGGSPNHFGDAVFERSSISDTPYLISTLRWQDSSPFDTRKWILPDIPVSPTFADFIAGKDRALEAAIAHRIADPDAANWRSRIVNPWDRESQKADWKFFYEQAE